MRRQPMRASIKTRKNSIQNSGAMQSNTAAKKVSSSSSSSTAAGVLRRSMPKGSSGSSSSTSSSVEWSNEVAGENYCVREVWAKDLDHELQLMEKLVEEYPYVAVDGRFSGVVARPTGPFKDNTERNYDIVRSNMELVKIVQLSLAFANEDGEIASHPEDVRRSTMGKQRRSPPRCVWKINFQFDFRKDPYCADALERLRKPIEEGGAGIDFNAHRVKGVSVDRFSELITGSGLVMSPDVRWITIGGSFLFAGLVRMLSGQVLPKTEEEFSDMCYEYFPNIRDLRASRWCSAKCGNPPRVPLHACASERAVLAACGEAFEDTSPTLAMIKVFFEHGGALESVKGSGGSDDSSVSSSLQNSDNLTADNSSGSTGMRRPSARWAVVPRHTRRPSQFALWEYSAIHLSSPAAIWRESGMDVVTERARLRDELEKEVEQEAVLSKKEGVTASQPPPPPPPPPPGPPPSVDADARSSSSAAGSPNDRHNGPGADHRHPLRHPRYPHGAPPPMSGAIAYKGPPVQKKMQRSLHWGCVQVPRIPSAHGRGHSATPPAVMAGGNGGDQGRRRGGGRL